MIGLVLFFCLGLAGHPACAADEYEKLFLELVNQARKDPKAAISALGLDYSRVLDNSPKMGAVLGGGLEPLSMDSGLSSAAKEQAIDMLAREYYAYNSPEGVTPEMRIAAHGYAPVVSEQVLGLVMFQNFISPGEAVQRLFAGMLKDELASERPLNILSPDYRDLGVALVSGRLVLGDGPVNVYILVCNVAHSEERFVETLVHGLVNAARDNPAAFFEEFNLDVQAAEQNWGRDFWIMDFSLEPLARNRELDQAAQSYIRGLLAPRQNQELDPCETSLEGRVSETGYNGSYPVMTAVIAAPDAKDDYRILARNITAELLKQEGSASGGPEHVLCPDFSEIGLAMEYVAPEQDCPGFVVLGLAAGRPEKGRSYVVGRVFAQERSSEGTVYEHGISGMKVEIVDQPSNRLVYSVLTGPSGFYQMPAGAGENFQVRLADWEGKPVTYYDLRQQDNNYRANFWTDIDNPEIAPYVMNYENDQLCQSCLTRP